MIVFGEVRALVLASCLMFGALAHRPVLAESSMSGRRDIYCFGVRGGVIVYARMEALCFAFKPSAAYHLTLQAAGSVIVAGNGFRLSILYPAERYAADFDPVPGDYFSSSKGFAPGASRVEGSAGNKKIKGYVINGGAGVDWSFGLLKIERANWNEVL